MLQIHDTNDRICEAININLLGFNIRVMIHYQLHF
jgi:hypothetical protein